MLLFSDGYEESEVHKILRKIKLFYPEKKKKNQKLKYLMQI